MDNPLGVSPSKGNRGTTRGKETILLTSVGIEPRLDLPLLCRLSYEAGQRKSGTIKVVNRGEEKIRVHMNVVNFIRILLSCWCHLFQTFLSLLGFLMDIVFKKEKPW